MPLDDIVVLVGRDESLELLEPIRNDFETRYSLIHCVGRYRYMEETPVIRYIVITTPTHPG